jgi:hypothetical protein
MKSWATRNSSVTESTYKVLNAAVAQLVEYLLAKQDVTSSNLVSRSRHGPCVMLNEVMARVFLACSYSIKALHYIGNVETQDRYPVGAPVILCVQASAHSTGVCMSSLCQIQTSDDSGEDLLDPSGDCCAVLRHQQ